MFVVEQDEGGGGDRADAPGADADPAQRLESGLEQRVAAFGERSGSRVQQVDGVQDVDFLRRTVRIEWQFTQGSKGERSEPKTPRSRRTIPLPRVVADVLAAHLATYPAGDDEQSSSPGRAPRSGMSTTATT